MAFKSFVRSSKFRHVHPPDTIKLENCYSSISINKGPTETNMSSVNAKFLAVSLETRSGGSFIVIPIEKFGRVALDHPKVAGHRAPVLDIQWNPFNDNEIASGSEDSYIKIWEIPDGGLTSDLMHDQCKITLTGHGKKVTRLAWHPSAANVLASSGANKMIFIWNTETAERLFSLGEFPDLINCFSWNYNGKYMAATYKASGSQMLRVYDVRKGEVLQETAAHKGSKPSHCVFLGKHNKVLTTGISMNERQYAVWDAGNLEQVLQFEKLDNSAGVLMPFWDEGTSMFYLVGKGDATIRYFEITDEPPYSFFLSSATRPVQNRGVCALPQHQLDYMSCEVMRFYRLLQTKSIIEPVPFIAPRKAETLQDDIFKTCFAPTAALSAADWAGGADKDPLLMRYTEDGLVPLSEAESQVSTPIHFKGTDKPKEKAKRLGSPGPTTLEEYKKAYEALKAENEKLKKDLATLRLRS